MADSATGASLGGTSHGGQDQAAATSRQVRMISGTKVLKISGTEVLISCPLPETGSIKLQRFEFCSTSVPLIFEKRAQAPLPTPPRNVPTHVIAQHPSPHAQHPSTGVIASAAAPFTTLSHDGRERYTYGMA